VPKKEFLKRKRPNYVPPPQPSTKQYKYYSDAIAKSGDGSSRNEPEARNSRRSIVQASDERKERRRVHTPNARAQKSSRQHSEGNMQPENHNQADFENGQQISRQRPISS